MILLWRSGVVDSFIAIQFILNRAAQYGSFVIGSSVGQTPDPSVLIEPVRQMGTAYQFVRAAQGAAEAQKRAATIAVFLSTSGVALETDLATNGAMAGVHLAFNAYMHKVLEASNAANIPFILTFTDGQQQVIILFLVCGVILMFLYYYIKLLIASAHKGLQMAESSNFHNKLGKFVYFTHQKLLITENLKF